MAPYPRLSWDHSRIIEKYALVKKISSKETCQCQLILQHMCQVTLQKELHITKLHMTNVPFFGIYKLNNF